MNLIELIYTSASTTNFYDPDLKMLLHGARTNNAMRGLTGVLLYDRGSFLQALEGPRAEVARLFERIRLDPRHNRIAKLHETEITTRGFGDWTMGFARLDAMSATPGVNDFLRRGSIESLMNGDPDAREDRPPRLPIG